MIAFKPKEEPLLVKIVKSGLFQFIMVIILGVGVTWFVIRTDRPQQWIQRINRFASIAPVPTSATALAQEVEAGIAEDSADLEAPPAAAISWAARSASPTTLAASTQTSEVSSQPAGTTAMARIVSGTAKLRIQMVEIDHDYLDALTSGRNGQSATLVGDIRTFRSFPNLAIDSANLTVLKTDSLDFHTGKKTNTLNAGNNTRWIRFTFTSVDDLPDATFRYFDVSFMKNHPNDRQQIPFALFLNTGEKFIISGSGLISYFEIENDLANTPPFQIFKSPSFTNQKTTFAIIIELQ